ncbi:hypothetical protein [Microbacterium jiangjiandongii]|uniref:hypothetical protein n=1 Tax=Microbacterium jiangjiandongii TaxID=3049071 RepID=UPI00214AE24C|nr:hypothetical protein [Microbacterium sp. zg.Y843]MCR2815426.1 hypothetical protein [Microbacterium sp. zg.Y843]
MTTPVAAFEVYSVAGEDRLSSPLRRAAQWAGTAVVSLFDLGGGGAPAMTDIVLRLVLDGSEVHRLQPSDIDDVQATLELAQHDLRTLDAVDFADAWFD